MRNIHLHLQVSADGFAAGPNGELDWIFKHSDSAVERYNASLYEHADLLITGRVLYQTLADYWPKAEQDEKASKFDRKFAHRLNTMPKLVLSTTLQQVGWENCRLLSRNVFEELRALKEQPGRDIVVTGGIGTARGLILQGLIDEFDLLVHPIILGTGKSLFGGLEGVRELELVESRRFKTGVVLMRYRLARAEHTERAA